MPHTRVHAHMPYYNNRTASTYIHIHLYMYILYIPVFPAANPLKNSCMPASLRGDRSVPTCTVSGRVGLLATAVSALAVAPSTGAAGAAPSAAGALVAVSAAVIAFTSSRKRLYPCSTCGSATCLKQVLISSADGTMFSTAVLPAAVTGIQTGNRALSSTMLALMAEVRRVA